MKHMTLKLTLEELELLAKLASDQLFRKEFIDPKMPGYRSNSRDMSLAKSLVGRLRLMLEEGSPKRTPPPRRAGSRLEQVSPNGPTLAARALGGTELAEGSVPQRYRLSQENE